MVQIREHLNTLICFRGTRVIGLGAYLCMVRLPALTYPGDRSPWADTAEDIAVDKFNKRAYGAYSGDVLREWSMFQGSEEGSGCLTRSSVSLVFGLMVARLTMLGILLSTKN